jgi:PAS domain S-box-containing protein
MHVAQRSLVLILARDLADKLATAMFVVDQEGTLVYFNEAAADILGESFGEAGRMRVEAWSTAFRPVHEGGEEITPEDLPLVIALRRRVPAHRDMKIRGLDGEVRDIAVTAFPLFARADEFVGAAAIFWQLGGPSGAGSIGLPTEIGGG